MSKKSKELLDNLNKIVKKPDKWEQPRVISDCNKMWKSTIDSGINSLPTSYDKDKWIKDSTDEDGDVYKWFDRLYGGIYQSSENLTQKDGTTYQGKLHKKRRLMKGMNGNNFYQQIRVTADGRWFDNCGFPIEPPTKVEEDEEKESIGFMHREPTDEENEEKAKYKAEQEQKMLKDLK
jgi:hypothetical protein